MSIVVIVREAINKE